MLLGYFARRVHDPEVAADLTAETFAAALASRRRFRRGATPAVAWLFGIAQHKLGDYRRRGAAEDRMRRRLGIERVPVGEDDREMIAMLGRDAAWQLIDELPPEQREAVRAHVLDDRPYAGDRGGRRHLRGGRAQAREPRPRRPATADGPMSDFVTALREELVEAAERERTRRLPRVHPPKPRLVLAVAAAAAMALILLLAAGALNTRVTDDERPATEPTPEARDLFGGTLQPGVVYRTRAFVPTLTFEVADRDWQVGDTTQPDVLILDHGERFFDPVDGVRRPPGGLWFTRVLEVYDPAVRSLAASLAPAPTDLHAWMRAHPDLRVGASRAGHGRRRARRPLRRRGALPPAGPRRSALPRAGPGDVHRAVAEAVLPGPHAAAVTVLRHGARAAGDHARALHEGGPPRPGGGGRPRARVAADHSTVSVPSMPCSRWLSTGQ